MKSAAPLLIRLIVVAVVASIAASSGLSALDEPVEQDKQAATSEAEDPAVDNQPKEKSLLDQLSDQLLGSDDDSTQSAPDAENESKAKMDRAMKGMRDAGNRLEEGQTALDTQKIQKQVIKDLEDIINQLENPPPSQGGGGGGGGGGASGGSRRGGGGSSLRVGRPQRQGGRGSSSAKKKQDQASADEKSGGKSSESPTDSSKNSPAARKAAEEAERRRKLEMDVWGHLPLHVREELLSTYGERMLPKYEQMVKQFYEALSTQNEPKKK